MPRKSKNKNLTSKIVRFSVITIFIFFGIYLGVALTLRGIKDSPVFVVKSIKLHPSISFIRSRDLYRLKGQGIFDIDLAAVQARVQSQYPEVSQLKVIKRYPNEIYVEARRRNAFAITTIRNRTITIDDEGVVLSVAEPRDQNLPYIKGLRSNEPNLEIGAIIEGETLNVAMDILKKFKKAAIISKYPVVQVNVANLRKINVHFTDDCWVVVDREQLDRKLRILKVLFEQGKIDFNSIKYVDLRFKEPVLRKK